MFDITNFHTFKKLQDWLREVERFALEDVKVLIVGNKADLREDRVVPREVAEKFASERNFSYVETSCKGWKER